MQETTRHLFHRPDFCILFLITFFLFSAVSPTESKTVSAPVKIGVLAIRGDEYCLKAWSPTAEYLNRMIPDHQFIITPLHHDMIIPTVRRNEVDFILANASYYIELEQFFEANRIATLKELHSGIVTTQYGSVIFTRSDRRDIRTIKDLQGKTFMAVSEKSFGGWQMAWREMKEKGIDPYDDFKSLQFAETHDNVIFAVRDGLVDAGAVRTNIFESLLAEKKIRIEDFYIFPRIYPAATQPPYLSTTREYPNWPMARTKETPERLAERVAVALLQMEADSPAAQAAGVAGWTIPLNYQPVIECMKELRIGPYQNDGKISLKDMLYYYGSWLIGLVVFVGTLFTLTIVVLRLNRKIHISNKTLRQEMTLHKILDKELEQAKEQAEAATKAKSQFLANMSHEIRTPMNGIINATELALEQPLSEDVSKFLRIVQNSSYALLGIINDILDYSKIEAGQLSLKERVFRLDEIFDNIIDVFFNQCSEKGIELLVDIAQDTPRFLYGDSLRLQQVITNMVSNSLKFTASGGTITISVKKQEPQIKETLEENQIILFFAVKDTGAGISPDYLPMLFEPFTQGDSSSTRKNEGTGLGLSICKKFVTMMHGTIGVDTLLGQGSTFYFTVRMKLAASTLGKVHETPPDLKGFAVLVVDDCSDSRTIMSNMLNSLEFEVETLPSGTDALSRLQPINIKNNPVDLILMDWKMPEMDGLETVRKIRRELQLTLPVIIMTAFPREQLKVEAEKAGANGILNKPIFQSTLFDALMDAFGKNAPRKNGAQPVFSTKISIYKNHLKGKKMLVAEDNITNQQVIRAILENAKISVIIASNGEEAVKEVQSSVFDVVLMDIQMPKVDGYQATKMIRALPGGDAIPIIAMTAHAMKGDEEKCLEAGMDGYIAKPIKQDRFFYTIWRTLQKKTSLNAIDNTKKSSSMPEPHPLSSEESNRKGDEEEAGFTLPGFNIVEVLHATGLNHHALKKIIVNFYHDNSTTMAAIRKALQENDRDGLAMLAHSLKGSAAGIGAQRLADIAAAAERVYRNRPTPTAMQDISEKLLHQLQQSLETILPLLKKESSNEVISQQKSSEEHDITATLL
ncbi:MAG: response regulator, partial [Desulfopila sp.]|nr:response regulator [Desulfopila sp.]